MNTLTFLPISSLLLCTIFLFFLTRFGCKIGEIFNVFDVFVLVSHRVEEYKNRIMDRAHHLK